MKKRKVAIKNTYWLIFKDGNNFVSRFFLKKGFGHILILTCDDYNWLLLDPTFTYLKTDILPYKVTDDVPHTLMKGNDYKIIKIEKTPLPENEDLKMLKALVPIFPTCVSLIKYIIGLPFGALTPWRLFNKLKKIKDTDRYYGGILSINFLI